MRGPVPLIASLVLLSSSVATAQWGGAPDSPEPEKVSPGAGAETPSEPVEEAPLPIYVNDDETGKPVPVLNWPLKELFRRAEAQKQPPRPPASILESVTAAGAVKGSHADLALRFRVWTRDDQWTRVPLGLEQAVVLPDSLRWKGEGQYSLRLEEGGQGYVMWIRGAAEQHHEVSLTALVRLSPFGEESRLKLSVPLNTSSELKLEVPSAGVVGEVSEGAVLSPPSPSRGGGTELAARWPGGDLELKWHEADAQPVEPRPLLNAEGVLLAKVDKRSVTTEATLTVRSHGFPFDQFLVSLPKGAELIPGNAADYSVSQVRYPSGTGDEVVAKVLRAERLSDPMEVRLAARQSRKAGGPAGWFELSGFEVIDAVRQWGHVVVTTTGDWQVRCVPGRRVRQVEQLPDRLRQEVQSENVVARFEYFSQPFSLTARVVEVESRTRVEPQYLVLVEPGRVRLQANLRYAVRGAEVFALDVDLPRREPGEEAPGWELDDVGPANVVAIDDVSVSPSGTISIPLVQPLMGTVDVRIDAHRDLPADASSLRLSLPRPRADLLSPAAVAVLPADNVELTPDEDQVAGLVREQFAHDMELPPWQQKPLLYRGQTANAVFAADFQVRSQRIAVDVTTEISLIRGKQSVQQRLAYEVAYEPLDKLIIEVPPGLAGVEEMEVLLGGRRVFPAPISDTADSPDESKPIPMRVAASEAWSCELMIRYPIELEDPPPNSTILREIPLVMPAEGALRSNQLYVTAPEGVRVQFREPSMTMLEEGPGRHPKQTRVQLAARGRTSKVALAISRQQRETTVVERAWILTWLAQDQRRERAVFRFTTEEKQLELVLPGTVDPARVELFVGPAKIEDRKKLPVRQTAEGRLLVTLPGNQGDPSQWLEVWYDLADPRPGPGRFSIELPRLAGEVWVRRMYWQLVLPRNEHVIVPPRGFTMESKWAWNGLFWGRQPVMDQFQLEAWSGAKHLPELPNAASPYLFSSMGSAGRCELRTASRWSIVLGASLAVLVTGLGLIYVPVSRHPALLLAAGIILAAAAVVYPGPALLASQAAGLGLGLALIAGLLDRVLGRGRRGTARHETSSSVFDRGSTQAQHRSPVENYQAPTETAPAAAPLPTPDSNR